MASALRAGDAPGSANRDVRRRRPRPPFPGRVRAPV
jgi:hypothetical protein